MRTAEEIGVRDLFALCHPHWAPRPAGYFTAFPTLVITQGQRVIGSTSFFVSYPPPALMPDPSGFVMWGHDVAVHPAHRGQGLGRHLFDARLTMARKAGMHFFVGMTWPSNKPMIRIFEQAGCVLNAARIARMYPENPPEDRLGLMFTRGV